MSCCAVRRLIGAIAFASACSAQAVPALPAEAQAFVAEWRQAAAAADSAALARLAQLPFLFEGRERGRDEFIAIVVPALLTPAVRRCVQRAAPQREGDRLVVWCKPYAFYLGPVQGRWRWIEFAADGE